MMKKESDNSKMLDMKCQALIPPWKHKKKKNKAQEQLETSKNRFIRSLETKGLSKFPIMKKAHSINLIVHP
jgi:hypothetical protein